MRVINLLSTIPFPFPSSDYADSFKRRLDEAGILVDTRSDYAQIVQALPCDFEDNKWYVVIHTGNLQGMIHDLEAEGLL